MAFHKGRKGDMDTDLRLAFSRQGAPTSPQTPNQIGEMGRLLNSGMKNVEVGALQTETFETIPKQHFEEMRRLAKLTDSNVSIHAPLVDPAGFTQQGWNEENREESERYIRSVIDKAHELNPDGNIPVNMHTTLGVPGSTTVIKDGKEVEQVMHAVDQEKGQLIPLKREELEYIDRTKVWTPQERLENLNQTSWDQEQLQLMSYQKAKQELEHMNNRITRDPLWLELNVEARNEAGGHGSMPNERKAELQRMKAQIELNNRQIAEHDQHLISGLNNLHHKYVKYRGEPESNEERVIFRKIDQRLGATRKEYTDFRENYRKEIQKLLAKRAKDKISEAEFFAKKGELDMTSSKVHDHILSDLSQLPAPEFYIPAEEFTKKKAIETFSNVASDAYKKYGDKAPLLALENFMPTTVLSRAEGMRDLIKKTRDETAKKIAEKKKIPLDQAKKAASQIVAATWDVGHIHQLKKQGFTEKELLEETEKIAPYVKHIHLTDNFGYSDAHLPLGMGDVPIKEHLKRLNKGPGKDAAGIVESGAFPAHFKQSPLPQTLEYLESPVYSYSAGPTWADARDMYASYLVGYGDILPEKHFDTFFGGGFSRLPKELGGQSGGNRSRFAGTPNQ